MLTNQSVIQFKTIIVTLFVFLAIDTPSFAQAQVQPAKEEPAMLPNCNHILLSGTYNAIKDSVKEDGSEMTYAFSDKKQNLDGTVSYTIVQKIISEKKYAERELEAIYKPSTCVISFKVTRSLKGEIGGAIEPYDTAHGSWLPSAYRITWNFAKALVVIECADTNCEYLAYKNNDFSSGELKNAKRWLPQNLTDADRAAIIAAGRKSYPNKK